MTVDGVEVRELDPDLLWSRIGLVPQKPFLFSGTVASNLRYGKPDATDDELWHALRVAQAEDFVRAMPDQLEAPIAQGGTNVSGGQRQRLSIARALVKRPEVYVFDDSFSALDVTTDARLRAALARETASACVIIVGQRVATIADADQIVVLEHGEIVGIGTHERAARDLPHLRRDRRAPSSAPRRWPHERRHDAADGRPDAPARPRSQGAGAAEVRADDRRAADPSADRPRPRSR